MKPASIARRRLLVPILTVALLLAGALSAPAADAAPGVVAKATEAHIYDDQKGGLQLWVAGWAYNPKTKPVQTVVAKVWYLHNNTAKLLYQSGEHPANRSGATYHGHPIAFGWRGSSFVYPPGSDVDWYHNWRVCYYAHDKGEHGGWVRFFCGNGVTPW